MLINIYTYKYNMKRFNLFFAIVIMSLTFLGACSQKGVDYKTYPNDPINARIYTLDNGLKVYMSVNTETPRIQTYVAVRVGGKNDPSETTGLAHYFEHLMFKGTEKFGTQDYEKEKPLLDEIERLFEVYRSTENEDERKSIYQVIDSISYEASEYAIPNEYDKLMASIGATGTNAYTGFDMTVYTDNIPSNQIDNWARIQADRFSNNVIRGFHTELETVYEEKNMSLTRDGRKVNEQLMAALFPHHPYGQQTVLGTQEHLKNPSITTIKEYYRTYYVPNNMAICLAGDFDPDEMIGIIEQYFGDMMPNPDLPELEVSKEEPVTEPIEVDVFGLEAENVTIGWRFDGWSSSDKDMLDLISMIMNNGQAGLIDLNLIQKQEVLSAYAGASSMADYCVFMMGATPKVGQNLEEAGGLLLNEINNLKSGNFSEDLIKASVNNLKLGEMRRIENNSARANCFVNSFINGTEWDYEFSRVDRISAITKQQIIDFANEYFADNYAVIYKREGKDNNIVQIDKPQITPIATNRDVSSEFLREIQSTAVKPIEPLFLDYDTDLSKLEAKSSIPVLYKQNVTNGIFSLNYVFDMGTNHDKALGTAFEYLKYLGTSNKSPEQIKTEFYNLACSFDVSSNTERVYLRLSGLAENMKPAIALFEELLADTQVNEEAFTNLTTDIIKKRKDAKLNQSENFNRLTQYAIWGSDSPVKNILSETELKTMNPEELTDRIKNLKNIEHFIMYYGPSSEQEFLSTINELHNVADTLNPVPETERFKHEITNENRVLLAEYDAAQIYLGMHSNSEKLFDVNIEPTREMYNTYFGGGMNAIVFQELREARGLAYTARAGLDAPSKQKYPYLMRTYIATQNDKMNDALQAFNSILIDMPVSENAYELAKEGLLTRLRTDRITKENILWNYVYAQDLGLNTDRRKALFEQVTTMTLYDIKAFQEEWVKDRKYTYYILGKESDLDLQALGEYGPIQRVSQQELFGY